MKTPYMLFLDFIATLVNGAYPEHYDTKLKRNIQISLFGFTAILTAFALTTTNSIMYQQLFNASTPTDFAMLIFVLAMTVHLFRLATHRRESIEEHILNTSYKEVHQNISYEDHETAEDANLLYDYIKVFFVLALLLHIPTFVFLANPTELTRDINTAIQAVQLYYFLLVLEGGIILGGRWFKRYRSNDKTTTQSNNSTSN